MLRGKTTGIDRINISTIVFGFLHGSGKIGTMKLRVGVFILMVMIAGGLGQPGSQLAPKQQLGDPCQHDMDCTDSIRGSYCTLEGFCDCSPFYVRLNETLCLPSQLLESDCVLSEQCSMRVANSRCVQSRCHCDEGFLQYRKHTCLAPAQPGTVCYSHDHCRMWDRESHCDFLIPNLFGRCQCSSPARQVGPTCVVESTAALEQELPGFAKPQQQAPEGTTPTEASALPTTTPPEDDAVIVENPEMMDGHDEEISEVVEEHQETEVQQLQEEPLIATTTISSKLNDSVSNEENISFEDSSISSFVNEYENTEENSVAENENASNSQGEESNAIGFTSVQPQVESVDSERVSTEVSTSGPNFDSYEYGSASQDTEELIVPHVVNPLHNEVELLEKHNRISGEDHSNLIEGEDESTARPSQESYESNNESAATTERQQGRHDSTVQDESTEANDAHEITEKPEKENEINDDTPVHTTPTMVRLASRTTVMEPEAPVSTTVASLMTESFTEAAAIITTEQPTTTTAQAFTYSSTTTTTTNTPTTSSTDGSTKIKHQGIRTRVDLGDGPISLGLACVNNRQCQLADPYTYCNELGRCDCVNSQQQQLATGDEGVCSAANTGCSPGTFQV
ncbi:mucin-2 [Uranotaenia lowii]|uniref:mucin-2 n=1 Tax=Uranotaenia lowii TaxID=190385 RepID=UPI00247A8BB5|nr:mucin-2 [Uranotaenia lowii]